MGMLHADTEFMREEISRQYDNPSWRMRVNNMPWYQVFAIYQRLQQDGTLHSKKAEEKKPSAAASKMGPKTFSGPMPEIQVQIYEQLSMFPPDRRSYKEDY